MFFPHDAPGAGPVWTPRALLAGFIKRTTIYCYTQNMKALGLLVLEKKIFLCFSDDAPRGTVGRIYKEDHYILLHTNMKALSLVVSEKKIFLCFSIICLWELITSGAGPFLTPGAWLAGIIKRTTTHCYIQNIKALGLVVSEKKIFFFVLFFQDL